jgi:L-fucose isomerase
MATENDSLNGVAMLFSKLLTGSAQVFADVRTYWSPEAVERVTGKRPTGAAANGFIHLINSGAASLDGSGEQTKDGKPAMKPFWEITEAEAEKCLKATTWYPANRDYFRGGGFVAFRFQRGYAGDDGAPEPGQRTRPRTADRRRLHRRAGCRCA